MQERDASQLIAAVDAREHQARCERLVYLTDLLHDDRLVGLQGQAAWWLFEDVKATWLYGCFASTVLTSHAFCCQQMSGLLRLHRDDPDLPSTAGSLEDL